MGGVARTIKKVTRKVTKPITKITKNIAKGIAKVGKSVMRGVAKLNKKLGPLGSIALAIAMPYALSGLSTAIGTAGGSTGLMNSSNLFLRSIGNVGNAIRSGYQAVTGGINTAFKSITKSIGEGFSKFSNTKGGNFFKNISDGAKRLYKSAQETVSKYNPLAKKGSAGQVEVMGEYGEVIKMDVTKAAESLRKGTIDVSQISNQTTGTKTGFFTKATTAADRSAADYVTETINKAYETRLNGFSDSAKTYFNDLKAAAQKAGTYTNDEAIGSIVSNAQGSTQKAIGVYDNLVTDFDVGTPKSYEIRTNADLAASGDYKYVGSPSGSGGYEFTGDKSFNTKVGNSYKLKDSIKKQTPKILKAAKDTLLGKDEIIEPQQFEMIATGGNMVDSSNNIYASSTNLFGAGKANFVENAFGSAAANQIESFHRYMNYEDTSYV